MAKFKVGQYVKANTEDKWDGKIGKILSISSWNRYEIFFIDDEIEMKPFGDYELELCYPFDLLWRDFINGKL